jgi:spoIIIJ-associated protein
VEWVVTTGRTIEEATEAALDQLGVDESDAEVEVVQEPQKGLFGRLRSEAQVRARVRPTAPRPKVDRRERRRGDRRRREGDRDRDRAKKGTRERVGAGGGGGGRGPKGGGDQPAVERDGDGDEPSVDAGADGSASAAESGGSPDGSSSTRRRRRSRQSRTAEGATVSESTQSAELGQADEMDMEAQRVAVDEFLRELMTAFGRPDATVAVAVVPEDEALEATIEGSELGLLVGQKGVTLAAVQELVRSMVQRRFVGQAHARVRVDVAGYRARRKEALERFATSVAESVKESGVAKALDPMGSADRKIVHDIINEIEGVVTVSEGVDADRRVVIRPE